MKTLQQIAAKALREMLEKNAVADRERAKATLALVRKNLVAYGVYAPKKMAKS